MWAVRCASRATPAARSPTARNTSATTSRDRHLRLTGQRSPLVKAVSLTDGHVNDGPRSFAQRRPAQAPRAQRASTPPRRRAPRMQAPTRGLSTTEAANHRTSNFSNGTSISERSSSRRRRDHRAGVPSWPPARRPVGARVARSRATPPRARLEPSSLAESASDPVREPGELARHGAQAPRLGPHASRSLTWR